MRGKQGKARRCPGFAPGISDQKTALPFRAFAMKAQVVDARPCIARLRRPPPRPPALCTRRNHKPTTMQISSHQFAEVTVVAPVGRIDHAGAAALEQALSPLVAPPGGGKNALILDFAGVEYISSVGLRVLMIAAKQMRGHGARVVVAAPQPVVAEILAISRFDRVLEIAPSVRRALEWLSAPGLAAYTAGRTEAS